jgi:hypothetical protein
VGLITLVEPGSEPVTLAALKEHLRIDAADTSNDADLVRLALTAREKAEQFTRRRFVTQQVKWAFDVFPGYVDERRAGSRLEAPPARRIAGSTFGFELPLPPVQSIDLFQYLAGSGSLQTLIEGTGYIADLISRPARVAPPFGQCWPVTRQVMNAVQLTFTVGYGLPAAVPSGIKTQITKCVLHWYENRGLEAEDLPKNIRDGLFPFRTWR